MNGQGESYSGVVPAKQPNEGLGRPKEAVEGRPLTKENMGEPNSYRTPSRESELNGLDRVWQAALPPSKVGTVCVSSASTGLCGGCRVTGIPTATHVATHGCAPKGQITSGGRTHSNS